MQQAFAKSHKSALCIIPPLAVQAAIQRVRCFRDKSFVRWPPHVNLLYPFRSSSSSDADGASSASGQSVLEDAAHAAQCVLAHVQPFKVRFDELAFFEHGPRSFTLWMKAADDAGLIALQAALQAAFPECTDLSESDAARGITSFTPHLSLGQWRDKHALLAAMQEYSSWQSDLLGLEFEVNEVCICSRQGYRDPFSVQWAVPLASATPSAAAYTQPQRINAPYIASTNPAAASVPPARWAAAPPTDPTARARFGLGAAPQGLFNFAFGANMSPNKLGGARGLHPAKSLPATSPGYRLAFNHRGGFGNLVAQADNARQDNTAAASAAPAAPAAPDAVHGVLHQLTSAELADLMCAEHEYRPVVVWAQPYRSDSKGSGAGVSSSSETPPAAAPAAPADKQQQEQIHQPELVPAIAFISPPERCIAEGLPPTQRYLGLLIEGARHWQLDGGYRTWLEAQPALADGSKRGDAYYSSPDGQQLPAWPKTRTGGQQQGRNAHKNVRDVNAGLETAPGKVASAARSEEGWCEGGRGPKPHVAKANKAKRAPIPTSTLDALADGAMKPVAAAMKKHPNLLTTANWYKRVNTHRAERAEEQAAAAAAALNALPPPSCKLPAPATKRKRGDGNGGGGGGGGAAFGMGASAAIIC